MAGGKKIGRNERCSCGSGRKYKHCCEGKARGLSTVGWAALVAAIAAFAVMLAAVFSAVQNDTALTPTCPAGQVWSAEHGHCHDR
jgi:hypothetical protein